MLRNGGEKYMSHIYSQCNLMCHTGGPRRKYLQEQRLVVQLAASAFIESKTRPSCCRNGFSLRLRSSPLAWAVVFNCYFFPQLAKQL